MGAPAIQSSICDTDEILELQDLGGTLRFGSESELRNYIENLPRDRRGGKFAHSEVVTGRSMRWPSRR